MLLSLSALILSCEEEGREPVFLPGDTRIELGLGGACSGDDWNTLFVEVRNRGATFEGSIEIAGEGAGSGGAFGPDPVTYRTRIEIPEGETRRLTVPIQGGGWSRIALRYRQDRRDRRDGRSRFALEQVFDLPPTGSVKTRVLAVGNGLPGFRPLAEYIDGSHHEDPQNAALGPVESRCAVTRIQPGQLPSHWSAYHPFQMVVLYDTMLLEAPLGAVDALASWVARGGSLVVFPGPASASGVPPKLSELLGATAGEIRGPPPARSLRALDASDIAGYYRRWQPGPRAVASELGLAVLSRHGAGLVTTLDFTPAGETFPAPALAPWLYSELDPAIVRSRGWAGNPDGGLAAIESVVASRLFDMTSFRTPPGSVVAVGLAVYLLFGFFLPHRLFKRRGRRELTFVVAVIAAALATTAVYRYGALNIGDRTEVVEVNVVRLHPRGPGAELTSFVGLLSPRRISFELLPAPSGPEPIGAFSRSARPLRGELSSDYRTQRLRTPPTTIHFDRRARVSLGEIPLRPNSMRLFRVDDRLEDQELIDVRYARTDAGRVSRVMVRNDGERPLFGLVIDGWEYASVGWLAPGEEKDCLSPLESPTDLEALQLSWFHQGLPMLSSDGDAPGARWQGDARHHVAKLVILGLLDEARGLGRLGYAWQALMPGRPPAARQRGLRDDLRPHEPRILLLMGDEPLFRPGEPVAERRAFTCIVLELPSRLESA